MRTAQGGISHGWIITTVAALAPACPPTPQAVDFVAVAAPMAIGWIDVPAVLDRHRWRGAQRVLFRTRSSVRGWMHSPTFHRDFAYIAPDAAQLLADAGVQLVGIDYISAEQFGRVAVTRSGA
jgi:kynurenine formamidase